MSPADLQVAYDAATRLCRQHGITSGAELLGAGIVEDLVKLGWTPPLDRGTDLAELLELHAQTTQRTWSVMPSVHEETRIVEEGRGNFGLIAQVSTSPADYGRGNTRFIVAAHREVPRLVRELASARQSRHD